MGATALAGDCRALPTDRDKVIAGCLLSATCASIRVSIRWRLRVLAIQSAWLCVAPRDTYLSAAFAQKCNDHFVTHP